MIQLVFKFLILCFDVGICISYVLWSRVNSDLVDGEVVVGKLALEVPDFLSQFFVFCFEFVVDILFLSEFLASFLEVFDLSINELEPLFQLIHVEVPVVDLATWVQVIVAHSYSLLRHWSIDDVDVGIGSDASNRLHSLHQGQKYRSAYSRLWSSCEIICDFWRSSPRPTSDWKLPHGLSVRDVHLTFQNI